jgi:hypothetical protein
MAPLCRAELCQPQVFVGVWGGVGGGYILRMDTPGSREFLQSNGAPVPG